MAHVLVGGEHYRLSADTLDAPGLLFVQDGVVAAQPLNVGAVEQVVVGVAVAVEQAVIVLRRQLAGGGQAGRRVQQICRQFGVLRQVLR